MMAQTLQPLTDERLDWYFWVYEQWYLGDGIFTGGKYSEGRYPSRAGCAEGYATMTDSDSAYMKLCQVCAEHMNAIVDGLKLPERTAVLIKHCELATVFRFRDPLEVVYASAREEVRRVLRKRGLE